MTPFAVYGTTDSSAGPAFRDALLAYSNAIKRVFESQSARHAGIQLFFDDLTGAPVAGANFPEQALAEAREFDAKAAAGFALRQWLQYFRELLERPRFSITGAVRLFPGSGTVVATIRDLATGQDFPLEASLADWVGMPMRDFVEGAILHCIPMLSPSTVSAEAEDLRHVSRQLHALALILASKIRWRESQAVAVSYRPRRWETVCLFAASTWNLV